MKMLDILSKKIKSSFLYYVLGLVLSKEKKVCTKMSETLKVSHDLLQRFLDNEARICPLFSRLMFAIAGHFSSKKKGWLIIDDTTMSKPFIKLLAGAYTIYNTALGRPDRGFNLVVIAWSNGIVTIPLSFEWYFHSEISGEFFRTKTQIAIPLIEACIGKIAFSYILFDAHYSTIEMIHFLCSKEIGFVAKVPCNRKVEVGKSYDQLRKLAQLQLIRNERSRRICALYHSTNLYFSVHKRKNKNGEYNLVYIVSNIDIHPKAYLQIYQQRWDIEEMFRTMKQLLGLAHCQSIKLEKQRAHLLSIFFAYSFLESFKYNHDLENPEDAARNLRELKLPNVILQITSFGENFQCFA